MNNGPTDAKPGSPIIPGLAAPSRTPVRPEFVSLPSRGGDPICGLSKSFWYEAERKGLISLKRIRLPGRIKGRTLLSVRDAIEFVNSAAARSMANGKGRR